MHVKILFSQDASDDLCSASVQDGHSCDSMGVCQHMHSYVTRHVKQPNTW